MLPPVHLAEIPGFLRFRVTETELNFGPMHGDYGTLSRGLDATLRADPHQRITSAEHFLDKCEGELSIIENGELETNWSGSIKRTKPYDDKVAGFRSVDYQVSLEFSPAMFDQLLGMIQTGQQLFGLLLDFQNVDDPGDGDHPFAGTRWDDAGYPHVAATSFRLRWTPAGQSGLQTYLWPVG